MARLFLLLLILCATPAAAQEFPKLTGRVVDAANIIPPGEEAALAGKLAALEGGSTRQLVVATVPDLQGYPIEDYGYRLGREWGIGREDANNGVILLVAPNDRKVRIEVGYGLEPILTDALSSQIIQNEILPRFREEDYPGGIGAGADAIIAQLQAPPEQAEARALAAAEAQREESDEGGSIFPLIFWGIVLFFIILPMLRGGRRGRKYRRGRMPIMIWGPGFGGGWGGGSGGSSGWGGGGGFGGFSGGGGSFGGGGASGGW
jgi:uncharacterized protein